MCFHTHSECNSHYLLPEAYYTLTLLPKKCYYDTFVHKWSIRQLLTWTVNSDNYSCLGSPFTEYYEHAWFL